MAQKRLDPAGYLKPRDVGTLPRRRGRPVSSFYPDLVTAFLAAGEAAMDVDVARIARKPDTVRSALSKAIRTLGAQDKVRVARYGDEVVLIAK
jgi:hypothetical protein